MDNSILWSIAGIASKNTWKSSSEPAVKCGRLHCGTRSEIDHKENSEMVADVKEKPLWPRPSF
jgi:hypothetical protein